MIVIGLLLVAVGLVGAALVVDLLTAGPFSGRIDLDLVGIPLEAPADSVLLATAALSAISALLVVLGISIAVRRRRGKEPAARRAKKVEDDRGLQSAAQERLRHARIEVLEERVRDLERKRDELLVQQGLLERGGRLRHVTAEDGKTEAILLIPELEEEPGEGH
jgi:hypothetical protein